MCNRVYLFTNCIHCQVKYGTVKANSKKQKKPPGDNVRGAKPLILAPAGNRQSFLAALSAGADAIYCGLQRYSARMEAKNFSEADLQRLTALAHDRGVAVYVAMNAIIHGRAIFANPSDNSGGRDIPVALSRHPGKTTVRKGSILIHILQ